MLNNLTGLNLTQDASKFYLRRQIENVNFEKSCSTPANDIGLCLFVSGPDGKIDAEGPQIRLTNIRLKNNQIFIGGYAVDKQSAPDKIYYNSDDSNNFNPLETDDDLKIINGLEFEPVNSVKEENNSRIKKFYFSIPYSSDCYNIQKNIVIKATDKFDNPSYIYIKFIICGKDQYSHIVYMSSSALSSLEKHDYGSHKILYFKDIQRGIKVRVARRFDNMKNIAKRTFGFKKYAVKQVLIYDPTKKEVFTFKDYRGTLGEENVFTFPVPAKFPEKLEDIKKYKKYDVRYYNEILDSWMVHEFGDYTVREIYCPRQQDKIRWLSEGIGNYLRYLYLKKYFPTEAEKYYKFILKSCEKCEFYLGVKDNLIINLLEKKSFGYHEYLCSDAFVLDIVEKYGDGIFRELFTRLNECPEKERIEAKIRELLSELLSKASGKNVDVTAMLENFSVKEAKNIVTEFLNKQ